MKRLLILLTVFLPLALQAQLAPTPPMGWNSWDAYGLTITEQQFKANADILATTLLPYGWRYAVIDEGWFLKNPLDRPTPDKLAFEIDAYGRYIPVPARFPSSLQGGENTGFTALAASVHARGLQFGIHIVRGIPRVAVAQSLPIANSAYTAQDAADTTDACPWDPTNWGVKDTPAGQAWYDSLMAQYASWGVDYLKVDCISDHPYKPAEIRMIHRAIVKSGRAIVLSLSPGPTALTHAAEVAQYAQLWRISDDFWDYWRTSKPYPGSLYDHFPLVAAWAPYAHPGSWPDADMLPLGHLGPVPGEGSPRETRLTHDEQRTLMTLWSIARSPLILGANLTQLDPWTKALLTNPEVLAVDQTALSSHQASRVGDLVVWTATGTGRTRYLAAFNLSEAPITLEQPFTTYSLPPGPYRPRDLWLHTDAAPTTQLHLTLPPHATTLLKLTPTP